MNIIKDWYSKKFGNLKAKKATQWVDLPEPERDPEPPDSPEISAYLIIEQATGKQIFCSIEPRWFSYNLSNCYVRQTYRELRKLIEIWGLYNLELYERKFENFPTEEAFYQAYPQWEGRVKILKNRVKELKGKDREFGKGA